MANDSISSEINNLLNKIVDGHLEDYIIDFEGNGEEGGNFLGDIIFINLKHKKTNEDVHLVVKQAFPSLNNPMFKGIYKNEINFYGKIWKTFNDFQKAHNIGFNKLAKYFGCDSTEGKEKIALDNLKYQGYALHDKNDPLTRQHVEMIMKSYGTFHAISFAYRELHPEEYAILVEPCKAVSFGNIGFYFNYEFQNIVELLENEINDNVLEVLKTYATEAGKIFVDCLNYTGDVPLLVQGDCWSNNMMFKFDERGNIEDMKFLDFQYIKSGSPVYDIAYSLYSGVSKDILDNLDFYLKMYHDSFSNALKKLGCDAQKSYPFEKFKGEWKQYCKFGFMMGLAIWRAKYVDKNHISSVKDETNTITENGELPNGVNKIADDKVDIHKRRILDLITHLYENGFL